MFLWDYRYNFLDCEVDRKRDYNIQYLDYNSHVGTDVAQQTPTLTQVSTSDRAQEATMEREGGLLHP